VPHPSSSLLAPGLLEAAAGVPGPGLRLAGSCQCQLPLRVTIEPRPEREASKLLQVSSRLTVPDFKVHDSQFLVAGAWVSASGSQVTEHGPPPPQAPFQVPAPVQWSTCRALVNLPCAIKASSQRSQAATIQVHQNNKRAERYEASAARGPSGLQ
jgi:hypothetical protein